MLSFFSAKKGKLEHYAHNQKMAYFLLKSILGFENWTKKMSKIENRNHFCAKTRALTENRDLFFRNRKV